MSDSSITIGLVGAPNSGKTTLFNWITGAKFKTVNYPGSTVDCYTGKALNIYSFEAHFTDTPGIYSLIPKSLDEQLTYDILFEEQKFDKLVVVIDATQLKKQMYLVKQVQESGYPFVLALTMNDIIQKEDLSINTQVLSEAFNTEVVVINGVLGGGVKDLIQALQKTPSKKEIQKPNKWSLEQIDFVHKKNNELSQKALKYKNTNLEVFKRTQKIDSFLLHPIWGYFIFASIMTFLFSSIFWMAAPFMDLVDSGFSSLADSAQSLIGEGTLVASLVSDGMISSLAAVFVFVPQIFILFLIIGALEDSGYLARATTLIDKPFSKFGMSGKSFVPLLSGFACAIPALMATRNLNSKKERLLTQFIIPMMTCSARLPVYALLLTFVFFGQEAWKAGVALTSLYFLALIFGLIAAFILKKYIPESEKSFFLLELPYYRMPRFQILAKAAYLKTLSYVKKAGPIIFVLAVGIWVASTFPNYQLENSTERLEQSYLGQTGKYIEPVFEPMGLDWKAGVGILTAFAAREVFVSTLAVMYNLSEVEDEESLQQGLIAKMQSATFENGTPIFTLSSVLGLILFFMIALQCMTTVAAAAKESGSWKFALAQLVSLNVIAYVLAVGLVQSLRVLGIS